MKVRNKRIILLSLLLFVILISSIYVAYSRLGYNKRDIAVKIVVSPFEIGRTYLDQGILYSKDQILHFVDASSKQDIVLCDKPNCSHKRPSAANPVSTCNAVFPGIRNSSHAIINDKLYFISSVEGEPINKRFLFQSDVNGANRRNIAEISPVDNVYNTLYFEDKIFLGYINQYDKDNPSILLSKKIAGVIYIDLKTHSTVYLPTKENFSSSISNIYYHNGNIYYEYFYTDIDLYNGDIPYSTPEFQDAFEKYRHIEFYSYNTNTKKESLIYSDKNNTVYGYDNDSALVYNTFEESMYAYSLVTGTYEELFEGSELSYISSDGNKLLYSEANDDRSIFEYKYYDKTAKKVIPIGKTSVNDYLIIDAIINDKVYVSYTDKADGEYSGGYILKNDFYDGNFDKVVSLIKYNK